MVTIRDCREAIEELFLNRTISKREKVGLEIEMFPLQKPSSVKKKPNQIKHTSVSKALCELAKTKNWKPIFYENPFSQEKVLTKININKNEKITFEPGGQIEFSTKPYYSIEDLKKRVDYIQGALDLTLKKHGAFLYQGGVNPWLSPREIGLPISTLRYRQMNHYFEKNYPSSIEMMRLTGSTHICLDLGLDHQTCTSRFIAAQLLCPFLGAIFTNSPVVQQKVTPYQSYRLHVWETGDTTRSGLLDSKILLKKPDLKNCMNLYLRSFLKSEVIAIEHGEKIHYPNHLTFEHWINNGYRNITPQKKDLENQLSLYFPFVRVKKYLEFRVVDSQARQQQILPALFLMGILYDRGSLNSTLKTLEPCANNLKKLMKKAAFGLQDQEIYDYCIKLMEISMKGLENLPKSRLTKKSRDGLTEFYNDFTLQRKSPADEVKEL